MTKRPGHSNMGGQRKERNEGQNHTNVCVLTVLYYRKYNLFLMVFIYVQTFIRLFIYLSMYKFFFKLR